MITDCLLLISFCLGEIRQWCKLPPCSTNAMLRAEQHTELGHISVLPASPTHVLLCVARPAQCSRCRHHCCHLVATMFLRIPHARHRHGLVNSHQIVACWHRHGKRAMATATWWFSWAFSSSPAVLLWKFEVPFRSLFYVVKVARCGV